MAVHLCGKSARSASRPWLLALGLLRVVTWRVIEKLKLILLLLSAVLAVEVSADSGNSINGMWVVDAAATERAVLEMAPQAEAAEIARGFLVVGGYFTNLTFFVEDDSVTPSLSGDARSKRDKFKLVSQNPTERKYERTDGKPLDDGLTITIVNSENIRIVGQKTFPLILWKRVSPQQVQKREYWKEHEVTWFASIQRVVDHLLAQDIQQTPLVPPKRWSEDVELSNGRRIQVEREIIYTFKHSMGDAGGGFGLFKNKLRNHRLQFKHPKTGKRIDWQGDPSFTPVLLDLI